MVTNREIADALFLIADYLEIDDENPFRIRAYRSAGETLLTRIDPLCDLPLEELLQIKGIGKDIAEKVRGFIEEGRISLLEEYRSTIPAELLDLKKIPGLGPKKISLFYRELGIDGLDKLKGAISSGSLLKLPGIKAKTVDKILKGIEFYESARERLPLGEAHVLAHHLVEKIRESGLAGQIVVAGSIRRMKETVGDMDILSTSREGGKLVSYFTSLPQVSQIEAAGETKGSVRLLESIQADLRVVPVESFGSALTYFTGSKAHNIKLRHLAKKRGFKLSEYDLTRDRDGERITCREEEDVYHELGMEWIPPELREDRGEIEAALQGGLPRLVSEDMILGEVHLHTDWSDGHHSLDEVCRFMMERGFSYMAVTDHSKSLRIAGGLDEKRVLQQREEIDRANSRLKGFKILSGIEVDILKNGELDLEQDLLEELDFVTGSIHSGLSQTEELATKRLIKAMETGLVDMIGHLTGRLLGERPGYSVNREKILHAARANGVILELNSHPKRLDIDALMCQMAKARGVKVAITTDMHHIDDLENLYFGIGTARRGWLEGDDVVNTWDIERFISHIRKRRP